MPSKPLRISKTTRYQNAALEYYLGLTKSPYLHYGYWEPLPDSVDDLTIPRFRAAQEAYAARLLSYIPTGTKTILDVGCGIGGNASYMLERGFTVEGLAPDAFQEEQFLKNTKGQAKFHLSRFEDFQIARSYDLLLFSESSQYMSAEDIANGAARLLNPGGYVLLADMLRTDATYTSGIFSNCHVVAEINTAMEKAGFNLLKTEDISSQIAPSLELYVKEFQTYGLTTLKYLGDLVEITVPLLYKLLKHFLGKWVNTLITEGVDANRLFERHLSYEIQLWQLAPKD
ncbi:MAG: methyltransferase domain-containing protein [Coleofasciculaceae cyanobacterium]